MTIASRSILVVSRYHPNSIQLGDDNDNDGDKPILDDAARRNDNLDDFNHPRYRRARILKELASNDRRDNIIEFEFETPSEPCSDLSAYHSVQSTRLVEFLSTAWDRWDALGPEGQDPMATFPVMIGEVTTQNKNQSSPLIPGNIPLPRESYQRPSKNVMGQIGFFCTDTCTPVFAQLKEELLWDAAVVEHAVAEMQYGQKHQVVYALATHPGHHAAHDSFGGYCYLNHAAHAARLLQQNQAGSSNKVAILDVDYHCGNGTASIFYDDPTVLVISIHCHPDHEYPFHSGFDDETGGAGEAEGATLHLPLLPGTTWKEYSVALKQAMARIQSFGAQALVVSLGLDTHEGDPCAIRRAGFRMGGTDYVEMGQLIGSVRQIPTVFIQEGGYYMDKVPRAVADVLIACTGAK
jgi:acetoin utilization deacetylase AcuC-like enzyme